MFRFKVIFFKRFNGYYGAVAHPERGTKELWHLPKKELREKKRKLDFNL